MFFSNNTILNASSDKKDILMCDIQEQSLNNINGIFFQDCLSCSRNTTMTVASISVYTPVHAPIQKRGEKHSVRSCLTL